MSAVLPDSHGSGPTTDPIVLHVDGMHCASCAALIEDVLLEVPGVVGVTVSLDQASALVAVDRAAPPGADSLCALIEEQGYSARPSA